MRNSSRRKFCSVGSPTGREARTMRRAISMVTVTSPIFSASYRPTDNSAKTNAQYSFFHTNGLLISFNLIMRNPMHVAIRLIAAALLSLATLPAAARVEKFPPGFKTQQIETNGAKIYVRVGGTGPAVVM